MKKVKLFVSYSHKDEEIVTQIVSLLDKTYDIFQVKSSMDRLSSIEKGIQDAEYYLVFISDGSTHFSNVSWEVSSILGQVASNSEKTLLPIILGEIKSEDIPYSIREYACLSGANLKIEDIVLTIVETIENREVKKENNRKKSIERTKKIDSSIVSHIEPIMSDLKIREKRLRKQSDMWNGLGYMTIVFGVLLSIYITLQDIQSIIEVDNKTLVYVSIKGIVLFGLLLAASKYAFTLAKSYMNEALKCADRLHAISFGRFYISVFGENINPKDFKDVFQNWNLVYDSSFTAISSQDYEPQFIESVNKIVDLIKSSK